MIFMVADILDSDMSFVSFLKKGGFYNWRSNKRNDFYTGIR